jgi:protocatechuate 3,4-dioxygenase beta subunit
MDNDDRQVGRLLGRREALAFLGVLGAGAAGLAATGGLSRAFAQAEVSSSQAVESASQLPGCVVKPELTEGPYFVDTQLLRSDIRVEPSTGAISEGVPLALTFNVSDVSNGCVPIKDAVVDLWQCDANGVYSAVSGSGSAQSFLRGYQVSDASGAATFTTIVPGWYQGRTVHFHFKIRTTGANGSAYEFTSQLFLDDALVDGILATAPYSAKGQRDTRNSNDSIFRESGGQLMLTPSETADGLAATFAIGLDLTDAAVGASDRASAGGGGRPMGGGQPPRR